MIPSSRTRSTKLTSIVSLWASRRLVDEQAGRKPLKDSSVRFHPLARFFVSTRCVHRCTPAPNDNWRLCTRPPTSILEWCGTAFGRVTGWSNYLGPARRSTKSQAIAVLTIGALGRLQCHTPQRKNSAHLHRPWRAIARFCTISLPLWGHHSSGDKGDIYDGPAVFLRVLRSKVGHRTYPRPPTPHQRRIAWRNPQGPPNNHCNHDTTNEREGRTGVASAYAALPGGACRSECVGRHKRTLMRWPPADAQRVSLRAHLSQQAGRCQAYGAPAGFTPDEAALTVEQNVLTLERRRRGTVRATRRAESRCACARPSIARRRERGVLESRICP
jgi:hypothetical protein